MTGDGHWRIDELAHRSGLTVDTIRFYGREGLLPPAERAGRTKRYGAEHLERLERIRELQHRRFSLAAIRALLDTDRPGILEGIFAGGDDHHPVHLSFADLVGDAGVDPELAARLRDVGLLRDPATHGRDAYDAEDLELLRSIARMQELGIPGDVVVELASIYTSGVEHMQQQVLDVFTGRRGRGWDPDELGAFQRRSAESAENLLPLVTRLVQYVHQRTLQRLTLRAIDERAQRASD